MLKLVFLSKYRKYIKPLTWRRSLAGRGKTLFLPTWYHNTVRLKIYVDPMLRAWVFLYFLGMLWANIFILCLSYNTLPRLPLTFVIETSFVWSDHAWRQKQEDLSEWRIPRMNVLDIESKTHVVFPINWKIWILICINIQRH